MNQLRQTLRWEAIEQYLAEVEREATNSVDQQVPQMLADCLEAMTFDPDQQATDFYTDELDFKKPPITAITGEPAYQPPEAADICDLDKKTDSVFLGVYDTQSQSNLVPSVDYQVIQQRRCNTQDPFWTTALNSCLQDMEDTCRCLGISRDPLQWNCHEVQQWIIWQCRQFNVPEPNMDFFLISGAELCSLSEEEFRMCARCAGSTLYAQLEVWRNVVEQTNCHVYPETQQTVSSLPVPVSPTRSGSSSSVSPVQSPYSDMEYQPETPPASKQSTDDDDRLPEEPVHHHRQTIQLWQFLKLLLLDGHYTDCIRWVDRSRGIFKIENSSRVARLWGKRKNRPAMNYDKLSRSIRQYYKKDIIKKTEHSKRLVYQFCKM